MMHNWRPTERLDTILDRSIDRLDEETPEAILRDYPQSGTTLAPMLQIADALRDLGRVTMPAAAKQAGRERLRRAVLARQRPQRSRPKALGIAAWVVAFLLLCVGTGSGLTLVSANALPDEPLYGWKRASERVWLSVQTNPEREIAVSLALAERRVNETTLLYRRSGQVKTELINQLKLDYTRALQLINTLPPTKAQPLLQQARASGAEHEQALAQLAQQADGSAHQILLSAVRMSQWVQQTDPKQIAPTTAAPASTAAAPSSRPAATPTTTIAPVETPKQAVPVAPSATAVPPTSVPTIQPSVPPTEPPTPSPTTTPQQPAATPTIAPQPARKPPASPKAAPTSKPKPPAKKPPAPPKAAPTSKPKPPGPPPGSNQPPTQPNPPGPPPDEDKGKDKDKQPNPPKGPPDGKKK
jgi:hypothetical protein